MHKSNPYICFGRCHSPTRSATAFKKLRGLCLAWASGFTAGVRNVGPVRGTVVVRSEQSTSIYHASDFVTVVW